MKLCVIDGCAKPHYGQGYCNMHWTRWRKHGDPNVTTRRANGSGSAQPCNIEGCDKVCDTRKGGWKGMCSMHANRTKRNGSPFVTTRQPPGSPPIEKPCNVEGCERLRTGTDSMCATHRRRKQRHGDPNIITRRSPTPGGYACEVRGCDKGAHGDGLCAMHYARKRKYGSPYLTKKDTGEWHANRKNAPDALCKLAGCDRPMRINGYCQMHNTRIRVHGHPGPVESYHTGRRLDDNGYVVIRVPGRRKGVLEHRYVMEEALGRPLTARENVHHINGVREDNRPENLELWVKPQPAGQRVADLVHWVIEQYPDEIQAQLGLRRRPKPRPVDEDQLTLDGLSD